MNTLGEKIRLVNRLQTEMEHRRKIEDEAEQMIIDGKFLEATELLQSLDDNLMKDLANELAGLSRSESENDRFGCKSNLIKEDKIQRRKPEEIEAPPRQRILSDEEKKGLSDMQIFMKEYGVYTSFVINDYWINAFKAIYGYNPSLL